MDNPKESALSGTGRLPRDPEIQLIEPPKYMRELLKVLAEAQQDLTLITGLDPSKMPDHMGAMLIKYVDGRIEIEHLGGIQGQKAYLAVIDEFSEIPESNYNILDSLTDLLDALPENAPEVKLVMDWSEPIPVQRVLGKKTKQNGRDAGYLDLDPTKKHGKRRR